MALSIKNMDMQCHTILSYHVRVCSLNLGLSDDVNDYVGVLWFIGVYLNFKLSNQNRVKLLVFWYNVLFLDLLLINSGDSADYHPLSGFINVNLANFTSLLYKIMHGQLMLSKIKICDVLFIHILLLL